MPEAFIAGTNWEQSSGPIITRAVHEFADDDTVLLWPDDSVDGKPALADGDHPILAVGSKNNRPRHVTGVVVGYNSDLALATLNVADKFISRQYVTNHTGYSGTIPNAFVGLIVLPGTPVYVDDSVALPAGSTLSFARNGGVGANPLAGYVWWCQDEYKDFGVGGPNTTQGLELYTETDTTETITLCIMQVNDCGAYDAR